MYLYIYHLYLYILVMVNCIVSKLSVDLCTFKACCSFSIWASCSLWAVFHRYNLLTPLTKSSECACGC